MAVKKRQNLPFDNQTRLLDAASNAFSRSGYEGASLRAIAEAADVSFQLIKHYFGSKHDLWLASVDYLYAYYIDTGERLTFTPSRNLDEQFREHLELMMVETLQRVQLRRIVILESLAESDRYEKILKPRMRSFYETRLLPYFEEVERLGIIRVSAEEAAVLFAGIVTNNIVTPYFVEYFLKHPALSQESTQAQIDLMFEILRSDQNETREVVEGAPEARQSKVVYPRTFDAESHRIARLETENRRLKQLVGELTLDKRMLLERTTK